MTESCQ